MGGEKPIQSLKKSRWIFTIKMVTAVITVEPSAIFGTVAICLVIFSRKRDGDAIIKNSFPLATSITSFEQVIVSSSL